MSAHRLIPRLLAKRDRLTRIEKDAIFESVFADVAPPRRRLRWLFAVAPAVAAAMALVVIAPWRTETRGRVEPEFAARGGAKPVAALLAKCAAGCELGDRIIFDVHGTSGFRYFAAFGQRGDGTVLWYFPSEPHGTSIDLAQSHAGVLGDGIMLGAEHGTGRIRIFGVFSRAPLTREAIRTSFDETRASAGPDTQVIATEVVVR